MTAPDCEDRCYRRTEANHVAGEPRVRWQYGWSNPMWRAGQRGCPATVNRLSPAIVASSVRGVQSQEPGWSANGLDS